MQGLPPRTGLQHQPVVHRRRAGRCLGARGVPGDADEVAIYKLWNAILHTARADGQDPESDWELHDAAFEKNLRFLNDNRFDYLHYTSANGTDLTIGMTKGHEWAGGKGKTPDGHPFFPNIPTEEVSPSAGSYACRRYRVFGYAAHSPR